jgi:hypothetical protein
MSDGLDFQTGFLGVTRARKLPISVKGASDGDRATYAVILCIELLHMA